MVECETYSETLVLKQNHMRVRTGKTWMALTGPVKSRCKGEMIASVVATESPII
jgi:hypothetical protein